jgi:hypothetical protein
VAYKKRAGDVWRLTVLDLASKVETALAETASVDDQVAWLDGHTVGYGKRRADRKVDDVWSVPADGTGAPTRLLESADSPAALPR